MFKHQLGYFRIRPITNACLSIILFNIKHLKNVCSPTEKIRKKCPVSHNDHNFLSKPVKMLLFGPDVLHNSTIIILGTQVRS
jgi:hypothetical protein